MNIDERVYFDDFFRSSIPGEAHGEETPFREREAGLFSLGEGPKRSFDDLSDKEVRDACFALSELSLEEKIPFIMRTTGLEGLFGERIRVVGGKEYRYGLPLAKAPYEVDEEPLFLPPKLQQELGMGAEGFGGKEHNPAYQYWGGAGAEVNRFLFRQYRLYHEAELRGEFEHLLEGCDTAEKELLLIDEYATRLGSMAEELKVRFPQLSFCAYDLAMEQLPFPSNGVDWQLVYSGGELAAISRMQREYLPAYKLQLERERDVEVADSTESLEEANSYARAYYLINSGIYESLQKEHKSRSAVAKLMAPLIGCSASVLRKYLIAVEKGIEKERDNPLFYPHNLTAALQLLQAAGLDTAKAAEDLRQSKQLHGGTKKGRG